MKTLMTDIIAVLVFAVLARAAHGGLGSPRLRTRSGRLP